MSRKERVKTRKAKARARKEQKKQEHSQTLSLAEFHQSGEPQDQNPGEEGSDRYGKFALRKTKLHDSKFQTLAPIVTKHTKPIETQSLFSAQLPFPGPAEPHQSASKAHLPLPLSGSDHPPKLLFLSENRKLKIRAELDALKVWLYSYTVPELQMRERKLLTELFVLPHVNTATGDRLGKIRNGDGSEIDEPFYLDVIWYDSGLKLYYTSIFRPGTTLTSWVPYMVKLTTEEFEHDKTRRQQICARVPEISLAIDNCLDTLSKQEAELVELKRSKFRHPKSLTTHSLEDKSWGREKEHNKEKQETGKEKAKDELKEKDKKDKESSSKSSSVTTLKTTEARLQAKPNPSWSPPPLGSTAFASTWNVFTPTSNLTSPASLASTDKKILRLQCSVQETYLRLETLCKRSYEQVPREIENYVSERRIALLLMTGISFPSRMNVWEEGASLTESIPELELERPYQAQLQVQELGEELGGEAVNCQEEGAEGGEGEQGEYVEAVQESSGSL